MSLFANKAQQIIYAQLTSALSINIFDDVPDQPEGLPQDSFPFVAIGDDLALPWDTDDKIGEDLTIVLHVWSRYQGKKETKEIMEQIHAALHRQGVALTALTTGARVVDCLHEFSQIFELGDGATRHGVCRYRLRIHEE